MKIDRKKKDNEDFDFWGGWFSDGQWGGSGGMRWKW